VTNCGFRISNFGLKGRALAIRKPQSAIRSEVSLTYIASLVSVLIVFFLPGCKEPEATTDTRAQQASLQRADRGEALIDAAAAQLADLPSGVDTELRPPTPILDASKSANGADVMAICTRQPSAPDGPLNAVSVSSQNSRFRGVGVRSGDILRFFIVPDETLDEQRRQEGFGRHLAMEFTVSQVVDDFNLFLEKGVSPTVAKNYVGQMIGDQSLLNDALLAQGLIIPAKIEIWRNVDDRLRDITRVLLDYVQKQQPAIHWEPGPDKQVLLKVVEWLNQWLRQVDPETEWKRDPLIDDIEPALLDSDKLKSMLGASALAAQVFEPGDGQLLQEAVWLRDISRWAQGDDFNDLARATALFDWTIRNVQLMADDDALPHRPWRTLIDGRGTANERAWVFSLLCRQQSLDVVMLEISSADGDSEGAATTYLPAVFLDGQLHLFDTRLGLPIPGPGGAGVATLAQVQQDDAILRQLDLEDAPYPLKSVDFNKVAACVVASPFELSRRAMQLESKLTGDNHLVLTVVPSNVAERLKSVRSLNRVKLWDVPFRTIHDQLALSEEERTREALAFEPFAKRPLLWKARVRHFQGRHEPDAKYEEDDLDDHREAAKWYTSRQVRPPDTKIARVTSADERRVDTTAKLAATYWVGLLSFDEGKFEIAEDWLRRANPDNEESLWASGTRYNLARTLEAQNKLDEAAKLLDEDTSPQRHGNRLRARTLRATAETAKSEADTSK